MIGGYYNSERFEWADIPRREKEVIVKKNGKFGIIKYNTPKEIIFDGFSQNFKNHLPFNYDSIFFKNGIYFTIQNGKYDLYNSQKKYSNLKADSIQPYHHFFKFWKQGKVGLLDSNCTQLIAPNYVFLRLLNNNFVVLGNQNKTLSAYSFKTGEKLSHNYQRLTLKNDSVIRAKNQNQWAYFREDLTQIPNTNGLNILFTKHGFYKVQQDSSQWLLYDFATGKNWFGNTYINYYPQSRNLFSTYNGLAIGVIDSSGTVKIPHEYEELTLAFFDSLFIAHKNFNFGVVSISNNIIIPLKHNHIKEVNWFKPQCFFMALDSGSKMIYSPKGEIIVPPDYNDIQANTLPKYFKTLTGDFQSDKPPLVGAYGLNGAKLAEAKYNLELNLSPRFVAFSNKEETMIFTESQSLGNYSLKLYTCYFDVLKCYSKDSLSIFYIDENHQLKGRFDYARNHSLKFLRELKTPDYELMKPKIQPMAFTQIYLSQIHGKWGSKSNYQKKLNGKPKFTDVRKCTNGYVVVNNDSARSINIAGFNLLAQETLGTLTSYGAFHNHSIAFDYNYDLAELEKKGDHINMASGIINDSTYKFTKYFGEANTQYQMILPNRHHAFVKIVNDGEPYLTTQKPDITLEDYFNAYNDFGNLAPGDWESNKLLSNNKVGIKFENASYSFKMNTKTNANVYGSKPFKKLDFLSKDLFTVEYNGKSFALSERDFRNRKTRESALSKKFDKINPIQQATYFPLDTVHHGFVFEKRNRAYTFIDKNSKRRLLNKYYTEIVDVFEDKIIVQEGGSYKLMDKNEKTIKARFMKVSKFSPNGFFTAQDSTKKWKIFNSNGTSIAGQLLDVKISSLETFFIKTKDGYGLIKSNGDTILPCAYKFVKDYNENGIAIIKQNGNYILIDANGKTLFEARKRITEVIGNNYIVYKKGGVAKLISFKNKKPIKTPKMNRILSIRDSVISYSSEDKKYFYSLKTNTKVLGRKVVRGFNENGFAVKKRKGNIYLINDHFEEIMHLSRTKIEDKNGWIKVFPFNQKTHEYINYKGQIINVPKSYNVESFKNNYAVFKDETIKKFGLINNDGQVILKPIYEEIKHGLNKEFIVRTKNGEGVLNPAGKWIFKDAYGQVEILENKGNVFYAISPKTFTGFMYTYDRIAPTLDKFSVYIPPIYDKITFLNQETLKISTHEGKFGYIHFNSGKSSVIWDLNQ